MCGGCRGGGACGAVGNCKKIGLPGKLILRDYFQENRTSQRPFLLLRISFPGRHIFYNSSLRVHDGRTVQRYLHHPAHLLREHGRRTRAVATSGTKWNFFLRVPQAVWLYCRYTAAPASKGNFQEIYYKTFGQVAAPPGISYPIRKAICGFCIVNVLEILHDKSIVDMVNTGNSLRFMIN